MIESKTFPPFLGIVAPVYNEEDGIEEFIDAVEEAVRDLDISGWELLLVNDGSRDRTLEVLQKRRKDSPNLAYLEFSRNFGHQAAVTAGLAHARGDAIVVMDADMQDPPSVIPQLLESWRLGNEAVFARRKSREDTGLRKVGFRIFHKFFRYLIDFPIPKQIGVFSLLDRRVVDEINQLTERNRFLPGLNAWVGFKQSFVTYDRKGRSKGEPKQSFTNLFKYAFDGVLSFSYKPMRLLWSFGLLISGGAFFMGTYFLARRLLGVEDAFTGFTTLVILVLFFGGITLVALGMVGEYVARIYDEVKNRPLYIVREVVRGSSRSMDL